MKTHYQAIIVGGGPAGLTAGIYLSRAKVDTLIITDGMPGGQLILTHEIANYPGVESTSGYQLATIMKKQAQSFGCAVKSNTQISKMDLTGHPKVIEVADGTLYTADSVILAQGGRPRTLGLANEVDLKGKGISYCATCDGDFFTGKEIVVVGGGNSALEEAVSLTRYATKVTIVHQFDHFQGFPHAVKEAEENEKINIRLSSVLTAYHGNEQLESVDVKNLVTGETENLRTDGVFVFIGYMPNTESLGGLVELSAHGEIRVNEDMETSVPGVFAAGDSITKKYRQVTTAVADGTIAALSASNYIHKLKTPAYVS